LVPGGLFAGFSGADRSIQLSPGVATTASSQGLLTPSARAGNIIGSAGVIAGGAFGAVNGFRAGGVQGNLSGAGSIAGAAAAIISLAGVTGPAAPIAAGIGLTLMVAAQLIGDPKKRLRGIGPIAFRLRPIWAQLRSE